jgi:hypothetical protein
MKLAKIKDSSVRTDNKLETDIDFDRSKQQFDPSNINSLNPVFTTYGNNNNNFNNRSNSGGKEIHNLSKFQNNNNFNKLNSNSYENNISNFNNNENDNFTNVINNNQINNLKLIMNKSPLLLITIKTSPVIQQGTTYRINPLGLLKDYNSPSNSNKNNYFNLNSGIVYFGYSPNINVLNNTSNNNYLNFSSYVDVQLPPKDCDISTFSSLNNLNNNLIGRYFCIYFNPDVMKYYLRECMNYSTYIKIQNEVILKDNFIINIGTSYINVNIGEDDIDETNQYNNKKIASLQNNYNSNNLILKIETKNIKYDPMVFQPTKTQLRIGRNVNCEISVDDDLLSRVHCTIIFKENVGWVIRDGMIIKNKNELVDIKPSTNGTWILARDDVSITEGMIIKSKFNILQCNFIQK